MPPFAPLVRIIPGERECPCTCQAKTEAHRQRAIAAFAAKKRKAQPRSTVTRPTTNESSCRTYIHRFHRLHCFVERSRDISGFVFRDSSTSLGMTENLLENGI